MHRPSVDDLASASIDPRTTMLASPPGLGLQEPYVNLWVRRREELHVLCNAILEQIFAKASGSKLHSTQLLTASIEPPDHREH